MLGLRRSYLIATLSLAILPAQACSEAPLSPGLGRSISAENPFVVSGVVLNRSSAALPVNARVVIAWQVVSGTPDYLYVSGAGSVRRSGDSFEVSLSSPPPAEALNSFGLGIGVILLTTDDNVRGGTKLDGIPTAGTLGAAGRYAVIYTSRDPAKIGNWATRFPRGYSVGKGVKGAGPFETFEPVDAGSVELIVDSLGSLDFVDWS